MYYYKTLKFKNIDINLNIKINKIFKNIIFIINIKNYKLKNYNKKINLKYFLINFSINYFLENSLISFKLIGV